MPTNITEASTWSTPAPVPNDGEGATAASLLQFAQVFANRTTYLRAIVETNGPIKFRTVATTTALKALTGNATGDMRYVIGIGFYQFDAGTTPGSDNFPWILKPASGAGQWVHELNAIQGGTPGLATTGLDGKVVQAVPNRIIDSKVWRYAGTGSIQATSTAPSTAWVKVTLSPLTFTSLATSDLVEADADFELASGGTGQVQIALGIDDGGPTIWNETIRSISSATRTRFPMRTTQNPNAGTNNFAVFIRPNGADDATIYGNGAFRVRVIRP